MQKDAKNIALFYLVAILPGSKDRYADESANNYIG